MRLLALLLTATLFITACKSGHDKEITIESEDGKSTAKVNLEKIKDAGEEMQDRMAELEKMKPLSTSQIKVLLPEELDGIKRSKFEANSLMGFAMGEGVYKEDDKEIKLLIYDCAGTAGAGFYTMMFGARLQMESESDEGYTRSVNFKGSNALEKYEKDQDQNTFIFFEDDRLLVSVQGTGVSMDKIKDIASGLKLDIAE